MKDLTGKRFGKLTVVSFYEKRKSKSGSTKYMWRCKCDCGNYVIANADNLKSGHTKSCKCLRKEISTKRILQQSKNNVKHGLAGTRIYYAWHSMLERCYNPFDNNFSRYGGRGIIVCDEWKNDVQAFYKWSIRNGFDEKSNGKDCSIDRIDVNGNYEPNNCRWVNQITQANNRRTNKKFFYKGDTYTIAELARKTGMSDGLLRNRLARGWDVNKAVNYEVKK